MNNPMSDFSKLIGVWLVRSPEESDDYRSEYMIGGTESTPLVSAKDLSDGEEFVISNVAWISGRLEFESYMPSTERAGKNIFSLGESGTIEAEFTFTVKDVLIKKNHLKSV